MAKENIAIKCRLYPTKEQRTMFAKTFGCCRKVYNLMLADKIDYYRTHKKSLMTTPAQYKEAYPYLKEVDSLALANEQLHLQAAYKNFFRDKRIGFPKFKSKKKDGNSYTTNVVGNNIVVGSKIVKLPKVGVVPAKIHRTAPVGWKLKSVTLSQSKDGKYYASLMYEEEVSITPVDPMEGLSHIGLDYKSDGLYKDSFGQSADMPHFYRKSQKKLAREQRRLSKKTKGSRNYEKQRVKVAKVFAHTANQRKDFLHKLSAEITNQYDLVSVETLNLQGIAKGRNLGKATYDNGYGMFCIMLEYKQHRKGHYFVKVGKTFPSSQLCQCGYQNPVTKDLKVRVVTCPKCGRTYDRDENAAINIDKEGLRLLLETFQAAA